MNNPPKLIWLFCTSYLAEYAGPAPTALLYCIISMKMFRKQVSNKLTCYLIGCSSCAWTTNRTTKPKGSTTMSVKTKEHDYQVPSLYNPLGRTLTLSMPYILMQNERYACLQNTARPRALPGKFGDMRWHSFHNNYCVLREVYCLCKQLTPA